MTIFRSPIPDYELKDDTRSRRMCLAMIVMFTVICVLASIFTIIYTVDKENYQNNTVAATARQEDELLSNETTVEDSGTLRIISRAEWVTVPPISPPELLHHPVPYVIIIHTYTEGCTTTHECTGLVQSIKRLHTKGFPMWDFRYNFFIGGNGVVYEDSGWDYQGLFSNGYDHVSIGIAFVGTFDKALPSSEQLTAYKMLIEKGVELGRVAPHYKLMAQNQVSVTDSPGLEFFRNLMTWPHWWNNREH